MRAAEGAEEGRAAAVATCSRAWSSARSLITAARCAGGSPHRRMKAQPTPIARQALPMVWDFAEANPFGGVVGDVRKYLKETADLIETLAIGAASSLRSGIGDESAAAADESQDAVITDPPYYDNISYADLSDFFYVWLKRSVGFLYPDHLGGQLTPKRNEAVVAPYRHHGQKDEARAFYEQTDGRRVRRGTSGAQARGAAGLHLRAQDHARLGHAGRRPSHGRIHDHRSVAPGHRDARTRQWARAPRASHRRSSWSRARRDARRRCGQRSRRYGRTRQDHRTSGSSGSSSSA